MSRPHFLWEELEGTGNRKCASMGHKAPRKNERVVPLVLLFLAVLTKIILFKECFL